MKKVKKSVCVIVMIVLMFFLFSHVNAFSPNDWKPGSISSVSGADKFFDFSNRVIGTIQVFGSISSVVALVLLGIKYVIGSAEEKAEYKQTMKPYLIGAIMVFTMTNILGIIQEIVKTFD